MDCNLVEEQFIPYVLGALEFAEREMMQAHIESCADCFRRMQDEGEIIARLAFAVPQLQAPPGVKDRLLARIDAAYSPAIHKSNPSKWAFLSKKLFSLPTAGAVASVLLFGIVFGGVWFNGQASEVSDGSRELAGQLRQASTSDENPMDKAPTLAQVNSEAENVSGSARPYIYNDPHESAAPGTSVNMLRATGWLANARGMLMVSRSGSQALLLTLNLRPLPPNKVYQVWLLKDGKGYNGGYFTVDSSGYGQTLIFPYASIAEFEGIGITIEPLGGSGEPTGISVLKGDL